jgi:hypothetical protein
MLFSEFRQIAVSMLAEYLAIDSLDTFVLDYFSSAFKRPMDGPNSPAATENV